MKDLLEESGLSIEELSENTGHKTETLTRMLRDEITPSFGLIAYLKLYIQCRQLLWYNMRMDEIKRMITLGLIVNVLILAAIFVVRL